MKKRPNFIMIFPDQWRGDCLGFLGHTVQTPFLDEIAGKGIVFTKAYSSCPSCIASRVNLITGQTPSTSGRLGYRDKVPFRYRETLMGCLRDSGYQTMCVGKTHFYPQRAGLGFEEMRLYDPQNHDGDFQSDYHAWLTRESGGKVNDTAIEADNNGWVPMPWTYSEYFHPNTWTMDTSIELLQRRDPTRPFFLQIGFHRPHPPYDPPISFLSRYTDVALPAVPVGDWAEKFKRPLRETSDSMGCLPSRMLDMARRAYYAQITHLDYQVGKLLHFMNRSQPWIPGTPDTYILFVSDHGEQMGDHNYFRKSTPFEGSARIPFIICPPVKQVGFSKGEICEKPVTHMDLMPTILEAAGIDIPASVEGKSVLSLTRGERTEWRKFIHGEHSPHWQFVTDGLEKFIWRSDTGQELFFNLREDPLEMKNLSGKPGYHDRVTLWRDRLACVLSRRPQDGLTEGKNLRPGNTIPSVRPHLLQPELDADGKIRPFDGRM